MASDRAPERIQTYQQGQLASSAVGTPGEDVSGQIIGKGLQQLGAGVTDLAQGLDNAQEIYAQFQAEEYANEYNKRASQAQARITAEHADDPAAMQSAYENELDTIATSLSDQMKNDRARVKFDTYTRKSKNDWLVDRANKTTQYIEKQNEISAIASIEKSFTSIAAPTTAAEFVSTFAPTVTQRAADLGSDPKYTYTLRGQQQSYITKAQTQAYLDGFHAVVDNDPYGAAVMVESPEFTATLKQQGMTDPEIVEFKKIARTGIQNSTAYAEIENAVDSVSSLQRLVGFTPGSTEYNAAYETLTNQLQQDAVQYYATGDMDRYEKTKASLNQIQGLHAELLTNQYTKGAGEASAARPADAATLAALDGQLTQIMDKFFEPRDPKGDPKNVKLVGTFNEFATTVKDIYVQYASAKAKGLIPAGSKQAQKFEQKFASMGNAARLSLASTEVPSMFSSAWFPKNLKSSDAAYTELASDIAIFAKQQNLGDAETGAVFATMFQESSVALNGIVESPKFKQEFAAQTSDEGRSYVYRNAIAQAYASAAMRAQEKYQLPGRVRPGQVIYDLGKAGDAWRVKASTNSYGHYEVVKEAGLENPQATQIAAIKKTTGEIATRVLLNINGSQVIPAVIDIAKAVTRPKKSPSLTQEKKPVNLQEFNFEDARTPEERARDNDLSR